MSFFEPNPETIRKKEIMLEMMRETAVGDVLTYQAMRERLNEPVTSQHTALRIALDEAKDHGMCFHNLPTEGYRRLSYGETAETGVGKYVRKIFRATKRGLRTIRSIRDMASLTGEERQHVWAKRAVLETIKADTHGNSINARIKSAKAPEPSALDREMERLRTQGRHT